jgi:hypothetical protein
MDGKVALEEHWAIDETLNIAGQPVGAGAFWDETRRLLVDFQDRRLAGMDANGISALCFGVNHVRACPSICISFQRARLEGKGVASIS